LGQTSGTLSNQQQQNILNAANTAGTLGQQQANLLAQVGQTSGQLTGQQMQNLINAGNIQGTLTQQKANTLAQLGSTAGSLTNQEAQNRINAGSNLGNLQQGANQIAAGLGSTASQAQTAQNQANLTAAQTAAQAAANQGNLLNQAGVNMGNLAQTGANMNLACINALSTLGGQQQTIAQNEQNYPLTKLQSLGTLLQGYSIPTGTKTTLCMSPLSGAAALGTAGKAAINCFPGLKKGLGDIIDIFKGSGGNPANPCLDSCACVNGRVGDCCECCCECCSCCCCFECAADGGLIKSKARGFKGCASTSSRGALPYKKG